jgi:hypothetical protein
MPVSTIYRQQWATLFSRPDLFQSHNPIGAAYLPIAGYPEKYDGAACRVVTPGTMEFDPSVYGVGTDYAAGIIFYQIGDETVGADPGMWDQRGAIIEIIYKLKTLSSVEARVMAISKGLFSVSWMLELLSATQWNVRYRLHATGPTQNDTFSAVGTYVADNADHTFKFVIQPGTVTGDPTVAGFSVAADGYWRIYKDGVLLREMTGIALTMGLNAGSDFARNPVHNDAVWIGKDGLLGPTQDLHIYRESDLEIVDNADRCCSDGSPDTVVAGGGQSAGAEPVQYPSIGAQIACAGGGLVPTQADLVHAETWWGN